MNDTQFTMGKFFALAVQSASESWVSIKRIEGVLLMEVGYPYLDRVTLLNAIYAQDLHQDGQICVGTDCAASCRN